MDTTSSSCKINKIKKKFNTVTSTSTELQNTEWAMKKIHAFLDGCTKTVERYHFFP